MRDRHYTENEAYALDREGQYELLKIRGIKTRWNWKEDTLVKKILKSNPGETQEKTTLKETKVKTKKVKQKGKVCPRCGNNMVKVNESDLGKDFVCNTCGRKITE